MAADLKAADRTGKVPAVQLDSGVVVKAGVEATDVADLGALVKVGIVNWIEATDVVDLGAPIKAGMG